MACYFGDCPCTFPSSRCCTSCCCFPSCYGCGSPCCDSGCDCGSVCGGNCCTGCCGNSFPCEREPWRLSPGNNISAVPASSSKYRCSPPREFAMCLPRGSPSCCCF